MILKFGKPISFLSRQQRPTQMVITRNLMETHDSTQNSFLRETTKPVADRFRHHYMTVEKTPNIHARKYTPGRGLIVLPEKYGSGVYIQENDNELVAKSPLAQLLFENYCIRSVFFSRNSITISKKVGVRWHEIKEVIMTVISRFYDNDIDIFEYEAVPPNEDTVILATDDEVVVAIKEVLDSKIRPAVQDDGGDIYFVNFLPATGIVQVKMVGACVGCSSSSVTLRNGVENLLKHYVPEVKGIENMTPDYSPNLIRSMDEIN